MSGEGVLRQMGGGSGTTEKTICVKDGIGVEFYKVCEIPYWQIEQIADAVVRKLSGTVDPRDRDIAVGKDCRDCVEWDTCPCGKEGHEKGTSMGYSSGEFKRYCDRNICASNEVNGISCDECEIAQNYKLEDDDSPCLDCGVE